MTGIGDEIGAHLRQPVLLGQIPQCHQQRWRDPGCPAAGNGATVTGSRRSIGTRSCNIADCTTPVASARSTASISSGLRTTEET